MNLSLYKNIEFQLKIDGTGYPVARFTLNKQVNAIQTCTVVLASGIGVKLQNKSSPFQLYKRFMAGNIQLAQCQLCQIQGTTSRTWLKGVLVNISPSLSVESGIAQGVVCTCKGKLAELLYNPLTDFVQIPNSASKSMHQMQSNGQLSQNSSILGVQRYATGVVPLQSLLMSPIMQGLESKNVQQTLQRLLSAVYSKLQTVLYSTYGTSIHDKVKLGNYIDCPYAPSKAIRGVSSDNVTSYHLGLCRQFLSALSNRSIYDSLVAALCNNTLLQLIPPQIQSSSWKTKVQPAYVGKVTGQAIQAQDISSITMTGSPLDLLRTPDILFMDTAQVSQWGNKTQAGYGGYNTTLFGKYEFKRTSQPKVRFIKGPSWLMQAAVAAFKAKCGVSSDAFNGRSSTAAQVDLSSAVSNVRNVLDAYTKALFFNIYGTGYGAQVQILPTKKSIKKIQQALGKPTQLKLHDIQEQGSTDNIKKWKNHSVYYGIPMSISYTYTASQKGSKLDCQAVFSKFVSSNHKLAKMYTEGISPAIYQKKG